MPYAICRECGRNISYSVGDKPFCPCKSRDFIDLQNLFEIQIRDLIELTQRSPKSAIVRTIETACHYVTIYQAPKELFWMYDHIDRIKPDVIVEIGCFNGGTLEIWDRFTRLCGHSPRKIIGLDIVTDRIQVREEMRPITTLIQADSMRDEAKTKLASALAGDEIDFAFIDGQHVYKYVLNDFNMIWPHVCKGGAVAFHDISWSGDHCGKFWKELQGEKYETKEAYGIGIIYKE